MIKQANIAAADYYEMLADANAQYDCQVCGAETLELICQRQSCQEAWGATYTMVDLQEAEELSNGRAR